MEGLRSAALQSLVSKEVENVTQSATVCLIDFRISTFFASYSGELLVLYIKNLGEKPTSGSKLIDNIGAITAFRTGII